MKTKQLLHKRKLLLLLYASFLCTYSLGQSWTITGNSNIASATQYIGTRDPNDFVIRTNAIERGRVFGTGGAWRIGSASHFAKIDSLGTLSFNGKGKYLVAANKYVFQYNADNDLGLYFKSSPMQYEFRNSSAAPVFIINASTGAGVFKGSLKIGDYTLPSTDGASGQVLKTNGSGAVSWGNISSNYWSRTGNAGTNTSTNFLGTTDAIDFAIRTNNVERLRITSGGFIGLGVNSTTSPSYVLNVNTGAAIGGINIVDPVDQIALNSSKSGLNVGASFEKSNASSGVETINTYNGGYGAGISAISLNGIGSYGYSAYSHAVYGYSNTPVSSGAYAGYFVGGVYASGGFFSSSDQNLKKNIQDVRSAMELIKQLRPKYYEFKSDGDYKLMNLPHGEHFGLLAQDVEKVLPQLVGNVKFETRMANPRATEEDVKASKTILYKSLNYTELIPILVKGMQEQEERIQEQDRSIQDLKLINGVQQQQIEDLKQIVQSLAGNSNASSIKPPITGTGAYLQQNAPNPFSQNTTIRCYVPAGTVGAQLAVYNMDGKQLKTYVLNNTGVNTITISAGTLVAGTYSYALLVDGNIMDRKSMIVTR